MKKLFFYLFLFSFGLHAQQYENIDAEIKTYPKLITSKALAKKIASDFSTDEEKVRAVFSWLTQNIRYDLEELYSGKSRKTRFRYTTEEDRQEKLKAIKNKLVAKTLRSRKGVCEGYAQTFSLVCDYLNIENQVISGHTKNSSSEIGKEATSNHAWNAVKINNSWIYIDSTWGAGFVMNGKWQRSLRNYFFNIPKKKLFKTHFPKEKIWQLRVKRMSLEYFYSQPIYHNSFLNSPLELITPSNGIIEKGKTIKIQFKNWTPAQKILCNFSGNKKAIKPTITVKDGIASFLITPPAQSTSFYIFVNNNIGLSFLLK